MLPPKKQWVTVDHTGADATDAFSDNTTAQWKSGPATEPWIQADLGEPCVLGGFELTWGSWPASQYHLDTSLDGSTWTTVFSAPFGEGAMDVWSFPAHQARYVRLMATDFNNGQGIAVKRLDLLPPDLAPRTLNPAHRAALDGDYGTCAVVAAGGELVIDLRRTREGMGMRIDWGDRWAPHFSMHVSADGSEWVETGRIGTGSGGYDSYWFPNRHVRYFKLAVHEAPSGGAQVKEIKLRISGKDKTPLGPYEAAAAQRRLGLYPTSLRMRQIYWTVIGARNDFDEVLFDEYGNLEPKLGGPQLMPYLLVDGELVGPLDSEAVHHSLAGGSLPVPTVSWRAAGISVQASAAVDPKPKSPVALTYRLQDVPPGKDVKFVLALRPIQINPIWQHGGHAPVRRLTATPDTMLVDGRPFVIAATRAEQSVVTEFQEGDVVDCLIGRMKPVTVEASEQGTLSAAWVFDIDMTRPEHVFEFWVPLDDDEPLPQADPQQYISTAHQHWRAALGPRRIELGDAELAETAEAQIGYVLVNQGEQCLQPGPRNYDRTWIRDGQCQALALMQAGLLGEAQRYIEWYGERVPESGAVPPIMWGDGSHYDGYGADIEFDAQGQFVFAATECYRYTRDKEYLGRIWPVVKKCLSFLHELRERTMRDNPPESRFHGLLAPSISHEGYSKPTHSSWDDFWGLRGWADGAFLAQEVGDSETAAWCTEQRGLLADSTKRALGMTMQQAGIDRIPSSADNADPDPTSTAIAFFPCDAADALPEEGLKPTYDGEIANIRAKNADRIKEMTTPYEMRCTNAFLGLGRVDEAHELLDYFMSWRRPRGWKLWAEVIVGDERFAQYIGDMPHTWIGAELYTIVRRCVAREVDGGLEFLSWAKTAWVEGHGVRLRSLPTHFGPVDFSAVLADGHLKVTWEGQDWQAPPAWVRVRVPQGTSSVTVDGQAVDITDGFIDLPV